MSTAGIEGSDQVGWDAVILSRYIKSVFILLREKPKLSQSRPSFGGGWVNFERRAAGAEPPCGIDGEEGVDEDWERVERERKIRIRKVTDFMDLVDFIGLW